MGKMKRYIAYGLSKYLKENHSVWHMPGHKRKAFDDLSDINELDSIVDMLHKMDVTEVPGLDDLHNPQEMIKESMKELAKVYGTFASYYLVNGSTCGIMAAIAACAAPKEKIIVASNCHKSVNNTVNLLGLEAVYIKPVCLNIPSIKEEDYKLTGPVDVENLKETCRLNPDARAVVITSPTYEGIISDIKSISEVVHSFGIRLIVDEAHGAHLPFLGNSAIDYGADLVVQSLHKTLSSMTQTAILHVKDKKINPKVQKMLSVFMSSSPSYVMLYDMERAVESACNRDFSIYIERLKDFRDKCKGLKNLTLTDKNIVYNYEKSGKKFSLDETRIVLFVKSPITGAMLFKLLADEFNIVPEMSGLNHVVFISTYADNREDFDYLYEALKKIDDNFDYYMKKIKDIENLTNQVYTFNTNYSKKEYIDETIERISGLEGAAAKDNIYVYPPGIYIVRKDEIYTKDKIDELILHVKQGRQLHGDID